LKKRARVDFCVEEKEEVFFIAPKSSQTRGGAGCISYDYYIFIKEETAVPFRTPPFAFSVSLLPVCCVMRSHRRRGRTAAPWCKLFCDDLLCVSSSKKWQKGLKWKIFSFSAKIFIIALRF